MEELYIFIESARKC